LWQIATFASIQNHPFRAQRLECGAFRRFGAGEGTAAEYAALQTLRDFRAGSALRRKPR
jgi:hypothetical protein